MPPADMAEYINGGGTPVKPEIVIVGAGVIGLQTALSLLESGYSVTIVAKYWPGDQSVEYTSPQAGAHWRSHAGPNEKTLQAFDQETYHHWKELLEKEGTEKTGLAFIPAVCYWDEEDAETCDGGAGLWWQGLVQNFRIIPKDKLPPDACFGVTYKSFCINPTKYMNYLLGKIGELGGGVKSITHELQSLEEVFQLPIIADNRNIVGLVNCTGMGARELVPDENVYPTRGQTILVKNETKCAKLRKGKDYITYVIHRPGEGTILGGCMGVDDWNENVDPELSRKIVERCKELVPEILNEVGEFDIVSEQVGRRPSRKGGPRIEIEWIKSLGKFICHEYGHSGAGYQNSVGSAREVVRLIDGILEKKNME